MWFHDTWLFEAIAKFVSDRLHTYGPKTLLLGMPILVCGLRCMVDSVFLAAVSFCPIAPHTLKSGRDGHSGN